MIKNCSLALLLIMLNQFSYAADSIAPYGVEKVEEGLYTGIAVTETGKTIYLGFERATFKDYRFWVEFHDSALAWSKAIFDMANEDVLNKIADDKIDERNPLHLLLADENYASKIFNEENPSARIAFLESNKTWFTKDTRERECVRDGIENGLYGFKKAVTKLNGSEHVHIVYASKTPITKKLSETELIGSASDPLKFFVDNFSHVLMTMGCLTKPTNLLSTSHMGICKNPLAFLDVKRAYGRTAMIIQGFGGECGQNILNKFVQANLPTPPMKKILVANCGVENVYNDSFSLREAMSDIPGFETVDIFKLDNCPVGLGCPVVIKLSVLAKFYHAAHDAYRNSL